jgi:peptidoglycan/LPS O-acetylase OafA/YrhL
MQRSADIRMIQALRAVACLVVIIFHTGLIHDWPNGAAGVDLFFVVSGFVMLHTSGGLIGQPDGWHRFLARRARRIVPLYWVLTGGKLMVFLLAPWATPHTYPTAANALASFLFIPAYDSQGSIKPVLSVGWTLNFEVFFYLLFAAALKFRIHPLWLSPLLLGVAIAGFWRGANWPAPLFLANGMVMEFAAGMFLAALTNCVSIRAAPVLFCVSVLLTQAVPSAGAWRFLTWGVPITLMLASALALEPVVGSRVPAWFLAIGDASYAIYLVHPFVVPAMVRHGSFAAAACVPASIAAGVLVHRFIDAPMQRRLAGRAGWGRPPPVYAEAEAGAGVLSL